VQAGAGGRIVVNTDFCRSSLDSADQEIYVELRGLVTMTPDIGRKVDTELSWKYDGKDPGEDRPGAVRVVVRIAVSKATGPAA
jgi:hypothetical protein